MTLLDDPRPISADSHALEGLEVFEGRADHSMTRSCRP